MKSSKISTGLFVRVSKIWTSVRLTYRSRQHRLILFTKSLLYNSHLNGNYAIDTFLDPVFYFIDHHLKYFGPIFVLVVFFMLYAFILIAYILGVPFWYHQSPNTLLIASLIGHWLLINVVWNYFKSLYTLPGFVSDRDVIDEVASFCKKCNAPKPPRAHHCSVCNKCILKMDHHCPWLNNCIGHFNHRYFYFFCAYTWLGTIFVAIFGVWLAVDHLFPQWSPFEHPFIYQTKADSNMFAWMIELCNTKLRTRLIVFEGLITVLLFILLGWLLHYHTQLISEGETCIERHINRKCRQSFARRGLLYHNPYHFGLRHNWRRFFGLDRNHWPWLHVLLPSNFAPIGDGFIWDKAVQVPSRVQLE